MNTRLLRHGFVLIMLALLSGFLVNSAVIPRLALSAHTIGVLGGVLLIVLGLAWPAIHLGEAQARIASLCWLLSSYANWFGCIAGAMSGAGRMTPVAAAGVTGTPAAELLVGTMLVTVTVSSFIAVGLSLWGLRRQRPVQSRLLQL
jgi:hydroxylaminobenzene mutase